MNNTIMPDETLVVIDGWLTCCIRSETCQKGYLAYWANACGWACGRCTMLHESGWLDLVQLVEESISG